MVSDFRETGFAVVRGVFSIPEIAAVSDEANRVLRLSQLIDINNLRCRGQNHYLTEECRWTANTTSCPTRQLKERRVSDCV